MEERIKLLDQFAAAALGAMISKFPLMDSMGVFGPPGDPSNFGQIKKDIAATAYEYAEHMILQREQSIDWLKKNEAHLIETRSIKDNIGY